MPNINDDVIDRCATKVYDAVAEILDAHGINESLILSISHATQIAFEDSFRDSK